jgi:hypothetical protein
LLLFRSKTHHSFRPRTARQKTSSCLDSVRLFPRQPNSETQHLPNLIPNHEPTDFARNHASP